MGCCQFVVAEKDSFLTIYTKIDTEKIELLENDTQNKRRKKSSIRFNKKSEKDLNQLMSESKIISEFDERFDDMKLPDYSSEISVNSWKKIQNLI